MARLREQHRCRLLFIAPIPAHEEMCEVPVPDRLEVLDGDDLPDAASTKVSASIAQVRGW